MTNFEKLQEAVEDTSWTRTRRYTKAIEIDLQARFEYLRHGGDWQKTDECEAPNEYARGFLDAMRVLGVTP